MQRTFVIHYLLWSNATKAAETAGYAHPGKQGSRLLQNPKIHAAIDEYFHSAEMSAREVVARLSEQARGEYGRYFYMRGDVVKLDLERLLNDGKGHLIKNVDWKGKDATRQVVEFYDAHAALVDLARIHGEFKDRVDVTSKEEKIQAGSTAADLTALLDQARKELATWQPPGKDERTPKT